MRSQQKILSMRLLSSDVHFERTVSGQVNSERQDYRARGQPGKEDFAVAPRSYENLNQGRGSENERKN